MRTLLLYITAPDSDAEFMNPGVVGIQIQDSETKATGIIDIAELIGKIDLITNTPVTTEEQGGAIDMNGVAVIDGTIPIIVDPQEIKETGIKDIEIKQGETTFQLIIQCQENWREYTAMTGEIDINAIKIAYQLGSSS